MTWQMHTVQLHLATCKSCRTTFQDTDADRLADEMSKHEEECR